MTSLFVTSAKGFEGALADELKQACGIGELVAKIHRERGGVRILPFENEEAKLIEAAYRICFFSRVAGRVLWELKTFECRTADQLYTGIRSIHWTNHIAPDGTMVVDFHGVNSAIKNTQFGALKTKDAICDQLRTLKGQRPSIDTKKPDVRVSVHLDKKNQAAVAIDLSGDSLHIRGYRTETVMAPLKENLAAGILWLSGWAEKSKTGVPLMDPFCGSGTIVLEGAFMALDFAPGLLRWKKPMSTAAFGFERWLGRDDAKIQSIYEEAQGRVQARIEALRGGKGPRTLQRIVGFDQDAEAIKAALSNLHASGIPDFQKNASSIQVHFEKKELGQGAVPSGRSGWIVTNPPYGLRIGETQALQRLYRSFGDFMKKSCEGWNAAVITEATDLAKSIGLKPSAKIPVWNGPIECRVLTYQLYAGSQKTEEN
ncbi:MAG: hypothetical protein JNL01_07215 [Bdellovibrionales bacterium]|nr:hypothetical protein [Bdellovibrionales bacterium]